MELEAFFTVSEQTSQFLLSVVLGAVWGIIYDCFRVLRIIFPPARKKAFLCASDIVFVLCCALALFVFSFVFCRAQIRFFCIFGAAIGFVLYFYTAGYVVTSVIRAITEIIYRILRKVYFLLIAPVVNLINTFCQKIVQIFVHTYENRPKIKISLPNPLKKRD